MVLAHSTEQGLDGGTREAGELGDLEDEAPINPANVPVDVDACGAAQPPAPDPPGALQPNGPRVGDRDPRHAIAVAGVRGETDRLPRPTLLLDEDDRPRLPGGERVLESVDDASPDQFAWGEFGGAAL